MKALGLALIAALAIGCTASPTSPSAATAPTTSTIVAQDAKPDHDPGTLKVTFYFYGPQFGRNVLFNMPVHVWSQTVPETLLYTTRRHEVAFDVPKTDTWAAFRIDSDHWPGVCPAQGVVQLPYSVGENWIRVDKCVAE